MLGVHRSGARRRGVLDGAEGRDDARRGTHRAEREARRVRARADQGGRRASRLRGAPLGAALRGLPLEGGLVHPRRLRKPRARLPAARRLRPRERRSQRLDRGDGRGQDETHRLPVPSRDVRGLSLESVPMEQPGLGRLVVEDFKRGQHGRALKRDLRDIYRFYLSEAERERLASMRPFKRWFWIAWWLLRNLLRRLSPNRRLLLVLAFLVYIIRPVWIDEKIKIDLDFSRLAFPIVLLVLALELKDKLLARDEIEV